ncbi:Conserved hypothetical protein (plasmid) [Ketogulonicigenium vulgare Y25]|uniref:Lysozyme inhibitor LprI-like N-terminal domain-containing protein n=2 Tax=Ketogulonicigenium vulgare TaxID=92945 RepID=F9YBB2_KETVW|nr:Conserved hypothetical protein [Ketogulonicigenium vulgare Y25]AEM42664.1 hypothetical protein KVU_PA0247 [Ketogulonicigenium vulgare WSH-001]ALJ82469.1 hypothetical protein KVH_14205 [Ketogulonicigenium vulgare]AOZ53365.1 hypothetical protein KVC_0339 [Ketogulonicigenium vulgare]
MPVAGGAEIFVPPDPARWAAADRFIWSLPQKWGNVAARPKECAMKYVIAAVTAALVLPSFAAAQAGFDCAKAQTDTEFAICKDAKIAAADLAMTRAYTALMERAGAPLQSLLRADQRAFLAQRTESYDTAGTSDAAFERLHFQTENRMSMLQRVTLDEVPGLVGTWRSANGTITIAPSPDDSSFITVEAVAADQANGSWLCEYSGDLILSGPDSAAMETLGGVFGVARSGAVLIIAQPYCSEAGPTPDGSLQGTYFRIGAES